MSKKCAEQTTYLEHLYNINGIVDGRTSLALEALMHFCLKVEDGTIQSVKTYMKYINIIENLLNEKWAEMRKHITLKDVE